LLVILSGSAILLLLLAPGSVYVAGFSVAVHLFMVIALSWFIVKVVWPVRGKLDELIRVVERHQSEEKPEIKFQPEIEVAGMAMGSYKGVLTHTLMLLEDQYDSLT
jgi:hypothetical protein